MMIMMMIVMLMLSKVGHINRHLSNQQTCVWQSPAAIQVVCDTHTKGDTEEASVKNKSSNLLRLFLLYCMDIITLLLMETKS